MRAEPIKINENVPINYVIVLVIVVIAAAIVTTFVVKQLVGNISYYTAGYFTITTLFDVVGVDASSIIFAALHTSGTAFETLFLILVTDGAIKIVILGFLLAGVVDLISSIHIRERIIRFRIKHSKDMIIIAGYGTLGERLCDIFSSRSINFVVIDKEASNRDIFLSKRYNYVFGDFTEAKVLEEAGIEKSKFIIFSTSSDFENTLGVIVARNANPKIEIISRSAEESSVEKMHYAGSSLCIVPEIVSGINISDAVIGRVV